MTSVIDAPSQNGTQTPVIQNSIPSRPRPVSIFAAARERVYPHHRLVTIQVGSLVGGVPRDSAKLAGWLGTKTEDKDDRLRRLVATKQIELQETAMAADPLASISVDQAIAANIEEKHLNGFLADEHGLYLEGRCVKACLKEGASIRWVGRKWTPTGKGNGKGTRNYLAERVFVTEERIYLTRDGQPLRRADRIIQRFVHSTGPQGPRTSIATEEVVDDVNLTWTIYSDHPFSQDEYEDWLVTCESNGLGSTRSQGYGTFAVVGFEVLKG